MKILKSDCLINIKTDDKGGHFVLILNLDQDEFIHKAKGKHALALLLLENGCSKDVYERMGFSDSEIELSIKALAEFIEDTESFSSDIPKNAEKYSASLLNNETSIEVIEILDEDLNKLEEKVLVYSQAYTK